MARLGSVITPLTTSSLEAQTEPVRHPDVVTRVQGDGFGASSNSAKGQIESALSRRYISPLRYPGGKRKIASHVAALVEKHGLQKVDRIIEPFAGGAATSIAFLEAGVADEAVLNDFDPLVSAFWATVFSDQAGELADRILDAKVDLATWDAVRSLDSTRQIDLAFKCIFLNRTSFSGSLKSSAGPIGGRKQKSEYSIDCRWNAAALAERVWDLARLKDHVRVRRSDFRKFIGSYRSAVTRCPNVNVLWYVDPPFFHKAKECPSSEHLAQIWSLA